MKTVIVVVCLAGAAVGWLATRIQSTAGIVVAPRGPAFHETSASR